MSKGRLAHALLLVTTACATSTSLSGRWIGSVEPATPGPNCTRTRGLLDIKGGLVTFAPNEGTWILQGQADPGGALYADHSRIGVDKKPFETTLEAHWTPQSITGTYTTPSCTFTVALSRS